MLQNTFVYINSKQQRISRCKMYVLSYIEYFFRWWGFKKYVFSTVSQHCVSVIFCDYNFFGVHPFRTQTHFSWSVGLSFFALYFFQQTYARGWSEIHKINSENSNIYWFLLCEQSDEVANLRNRCSPNLRNRFPC